MFAASLELSLPACLRFTAAGALLLAASASALPAIDPPAQTAPTDYQQFFIGTEQHAVYRAQGYAYGDVNRQYKVSRYAMPVDGSSWSVQTTNFPSGFVVQGMAKGLVYGLMDQNGDFVAEDFRVLDANTQALIASYPTTTSLHGLSVLRQENGCVVTVQSFGKSIMLLSFDATTRTIGEWHFDFSSLGNYTSNRLAGAGDNWFTFHCSNSLQDLNRLITIDPISYGKMGETNVTGSVPATPMYANSADTQFHVVMGKVLAMDVNTGATTLIGDGVSGAIANPEFITARGNELWVQGYVGSFSSNTAELQMWRKGAGGQWQMEFRGRPDRDPLYNGNPFGELIATAEGCFSEGSSLTDYYVPALSRPILKVPTEVRLKDGGGKQTVKIQLDRPATAPLSVRVRNGGGTATAGSDYTAIDKVLNFPSGSSEVTLEVDVLGDLVPEAHETIELLFSEPQGLYLPTLKRGNLVIEASGLELQELKFLTSTGTPILGATLWMRDEEVTVGVAATPSSNSTPQVCIWENATGALRGTIAGVPTEVNYPPLPRFLPTPEGIDVQYMQGDNIILVRVSRKNGSILSSGSFAKPGVGIKDITLLGGGRALVAYSENGNSDSWAARMIAIGGAPGGTAFAAAPPHSNGNYPTFISDGRYLIGRWGSHPLSYGYGSRAMLGAFDPVTLASLWQLELEDYLHIQPQAIRGNLLLGSTNSGMIGMDLTTREILWRQTAEASGGNINAVGDRIWYGGGYGPAAYDLATGAKISTPAYLGEATDATDQVAVAGLGGVVMRDVAFFPGSPTLGSRFCLVSDRRTRPGVQLLNQSLEQSHDGSQLAFRTVEKTNVPVQVHVSYWDPNIPSSTGDPNYILPPAVTLPQDGSAAGVFYRLKPTGGPPSPSVFGVGFKIATAGQPSLIGEERLPLVSGIPIAPAHLGTVVASTPTNSLPSGYQHPKYSGIRANDGKVVAFTGKGYGGPVIPTHRVDVIDAVSGNLLRRIVDPVPLPNRMFGINAIAQGDKVLIVSRMAGAETGTAEIFSISTGQPLAVLTYKGNVPGFGDVISSNANYFAIAIPGMDIGRPAGSQIEVFRWSDYKRAFRKAGGKNSQLGYGMTFKGDTLYASAPGGSKPNKPYDPLKGKVFGFKIGGKGKVPVPTGTSGVLAAGQSNLIVGNTVHLRAYDFATMQMKWSVPFAQNLMDYQGPIAAGEGVVSVRDLRDLVMLSEADGKPVGTTRFFTAMDNALYGNLFGAEFSNGSAFTLVDGTVTKWPMKALGDFSTWRWLQGLTLAQAGPQEDRDGNSIADFDDYVASRLNPAAPFATAVHENGKVKLDSAVLPPPDVLVVAEAEVKPGTWSAIGWRDGHAGWNGPSQTSASGPLLVDLPSSSVAQPPVRFRYLPNGSFGAGWGDTVWPPEDQIEESSGIQALAMTLPVDSDGDGLPDWLERQLGLQGNGAPLGMISGPQGAGVSYLRPLGGGDFDVESSADLLLWISAKDDGGVEIGVVPENAEFERVTIRGKASVAQRFFRVKY